MDNNQANNGHKPQPPFMNQPFGSQVVLPNSTAILVLGILSIVFFWCYGLPGIVLGIIALALSGRSNSLYKENSEAYTISSYNNMKAGRICAIIGTVISSLWMIFMIALLINGAFNSSSPWGRYYY